ncbi:MAG TPA: beta-L-arabinofuranosidase domain-containing protein, partial [Terriglobia bacterium]|nr:beta-L-arabinofuranosidase domain-containing protein [Terriglobia bacterium]
KAYQALGERKYLDAAQNAWDMIEKTQQFASGGWGPNETFVKPNEGKLGESLTSSHAHFETPCGAYAHLKLARYLIGFTGDARYGDGIERVLYNTVLGAKDPKGDGQFFYYSDYHPAAQKVYFHDDWPCCSGTLPEVVADYVISSYFWGTDGIYVNLFTPSEVRWKFQGVPVRLTQTTDYPLAEETEIQVQPETPAEFTVFVRIPGWLQSPAKIEVNGKPLSVPAERRTFAAIRRRWRPNDRIQVTLPFSFRSEAVDEQHPSTVALMRGPLMLVALDPQLTLSQRAVGSPQGLKSIPHQAMAFELPESETKLRFEPFYRVKDRAYTNYLKLV